MAQRSPTDNLIGGGGYPESTIICQNQNQNHANKTRPPGVTLSDRNKDRISKTNNLMQTSVFQNKRYI
jgi:hypothetical protein